MLAGMLLRRKEIPVPQNSQVSQRSLDRLCLVGESAAIREVRAQIAKVASSSSSVLITGESGTGKEVVARAIHAASARAAQSFVPINCGAIPETLLESQLFGHAKGAFTNAVRANPGLFQIADKGTLYLDEIGDLPLYLQVKLLRVIEEGEVWIVGGIKPVAVDVRIVASTNHELPAEVAAGRFRDDLFYRLNVFHITLPPLRDRPGDISLLAMYFIRKLNAVLGTKFRGLKQEALEVLISRRWKGNVRELANVLERAMVLGEGDLIQPHHLPPDLVASPKTFSLREALHRFERKHILDVIAQAESDKKQAARLLGISLTSLYRKLNDRPHQVFSSRSHK